MVNQYPTHQEPSGQPSGQVVRIEVQPPVDSQTLHATVDSVFTEGNTVSGVILDLSQVDFIESSGLGALVAVFKRCGDKQCPVVFLNPQSYVMKLIEITRLDKVFTIKQELAEAVTAAGGQ